jgi:hypothetical protein
MNAEHIHARQLLKVIRDRIKAGEAPILGYSTAAELIGLDGDTHARHMGQVTSRIDAASLMSGWPMLALHMVRKPNGEINPASFIHDDWQSWNEEIKRVAVGHSWTIAEVDEVIGALDALADAAAVNIWVNYIRREGRQPGFIRYNLHRKLRKTP